MSVVALERGRATAVSASSPDRHRDLARLIDGVSRRPPLLDDLLRVGLPWRPVARVEGVEAVVEAWRRRRNRKARREDRFDQCVGERRWSDDEPPEDALVGWDQRFIPYQGMFVDQIEQSDFDDF